MVVDFKTIQILWPEVILLILATWIYVGGTLKEHRAGWTLFSVLTYLGAGWVIYWMEAGYWQQPAAGAFYTGPVVVDYLGYVSRYLILSFGILLTLVLARSAPQRLVTEALGTLMLLVVGLMIVVRANDLVLLLVGLEMISIPTYVLLYLGRRERSASEAAVKYFFLSVLASMMLLYGVSFMYGVSGTTSLAAVEHVANQETTGVSALSSLAFVLILAGLGFKLAAVPFHFYAPDVYQGATNANAALLAIAPKIAGVIAFVRILVVALPEAGGLAWQTVLVLAILTMTLGNVCAIRQQNIRRLMAYSSIAHAGYLLIGLSAGLAGAGTSTEQSGLAAAFLYLMVYSLASLGTFAVLAGLSDDSEELSSVESLAGLGSSRPLAAAVLAVCMFSLAGIPPLAGFWGKLTLFTSAIRAASEASRPDVGFWFTLLAVVGAVNAAIAAAYYLRVVAVMYFRPAVRSYPEGNLGVSAAMIVCALLVLAVGAAPRYAVEAAKSSAAGLRNPGQIDERAATGLIRLDSAGEEVSYRRGGDSGMIGGFGKAHSL